jgi:hypothetical protein
MSVDDLDQTPTVMLVQRTLELARSEPVLQSDEYWAQVRALHFRAGRDVFEEAVGLCANPDLISRAVGADILAQLGVRSEPASQTTRLRTRPHRFLSPYSPMGNHRSPLPPFMPWAIWEWANQRTLRDWQAMRRRTFVVLLRTPLAAVMITPPSIR